MATIPVGVAILILVPASGTDALSANRPGAAAIRTDAGLQRAGFERVVQGTPPVPSRTLPRAVDTRGQVYEQVLPADYVEEVSAEEEGLPSPQRPRKVTELPAFSPVPSASPEPSA